MSYRQAFWVGLMAVVLVLVFSVTITFLDFREWWVRKTAVWGFLSVGAVAAAVGTVELYRTAYGGHGEKDRNRLARLIGLSIPLLLLVGWLGGMGEVVHTVLHPGHKLVDPWWPDSLEPERTGPGLIVGAIYGFSIYWYVGWGSRAG